MKRISKQNGAALFIALVMLVVLTVVGISSMQSTNLEERMASNQKDYYLAFESAEFALLQAEAVLSDLSTLKDFNVSGVGGYYRDHEVGSSIWQDESLWSDGSKHVNATANGMTAAAPKYIIEALAEVIPDIDTTSLGNDYDQSIGEEITVFRVTARGQSGRGSVVFLQSTYSKRIN